MTAPLTFHQVPIVAAMMASFALCTSMVRCEESAKLLERGKVVYEQQCVKCHGDNGAGTKELCPDPLAGDLSVGALSEVVSESMPEDDPETCVGQDALAVASYIHGAFYSEAARSQLQLPRISLSRLTKTQLRQSLADLYAYNTGAVWSAQDRGIQGLYFDGAKWNDQNKRIERTDRVLDFDFGHEGPGQGINPKDFFVAWRGAIKADATGTYEIIIRSSCAFVCYFGAYDRTFIDNHVQSGEKTEFRRSILLTSGRVYPLRADFFQRKRKTEQPPARISLSWKTPHGSEQIIPSRNLVAVSAPPTFSIQTRLPPDDRTYGYERGISVDRQWDDSTTDAAIEFAQIAAEELWPRYKQRNGNKADDSRAHLRGFLEEIVGTAFRGPLDESDRKTYVDEPVGATEDDVEAINRSLLLSLKSPRFLYPMLDVDRSISQRAANRLALTLFDSLPTDAWLLLRARGNELESEEQVRSAAQRMVYDYRTQSKMHEFFVEWLHISNVGEIVKEEKEFEGFDQELVSDLRSSLDTFIDGIVWSDASDYRRLFQADWTYTTDRLAEFYGESWRPVDASGQGLRRSVGDPDHRFGLLSHPYLMSKLSYHDTTSPIHRGVFLIRHVLGRTLRPPKDAFSPLAPELHPDLTTRERVELQTNDTNCQVCHIKINGLGFALENYDAVGRYRLTERDRPIDSAGSYTTRAGTESQFEGPRQLANFLAGSGDAHQAFVNQVFQHFVKQPPAAFGHESLDKLTDQFEKSGTNIRKLLVEIAVLVATNANQPNEEKPSDGEPSHEKPDDQT